MATLVLAKTFLPDYADLEKPVRAKVDALFTKFREATHSGLHLEKYSGQKDPRARTIRVDNFYRGIVAAPERGDTFILTVTSLNAPNLILTATGTTQIITFHDLYLPILYQLD